MFAASEPTGDLTAKARIRETALRLFAERGADDVSVRDVATAADVSAGLVMHHFGSKAGLIGAVNDQVGRTLEAILDRLSDTGLGDSLAGGDVTSLAEAFVAGFPAGSAIPDYLRRLWLTNDPVGDRIFLRWLADSERVLVALEEAGVARSSNDRRVRAAFLLVNDLAPLLLAPQLRNALGIDVQTPSGMAAWTSEALDVYAQGAYRAHDQGET